MTDEREQVGDPKGLTGCARCRWEADGLLSDKAAMREQRIDHAASWDHQLCIICTRSLPESEQQTCASCLTRVREDLAGVVLLYDELPKHLVHVSGGRYDRGRTGSADGRPLPGGDVLTLLGKGSEGLAEDAVTTKEGDPHSIAYELGWWEAEWRETRGETVLRSPRSARAEVRDAAAYLERRSWWASREHHGFDEFAADLRRLHGELERVTGRSAVRQVAEAECFDCGGDLVRKVRDGATRCGHQMPEFPPAAIVPWGIRFAIEERRAWHAAQLEEWEQAHGRCQQGGYADVWTCSRCGHVYQWQRYLLALRAHLQAHPAQGWSLPEHVALTVGMNAKTIRTWAGRARVASACLLGDRRLRVWFPEVAQLAEDLAAREAAREERRRLAALEAAQADGTEPATRHDQAS